MGNFKKAFIPLGLSAGFMAFSLFGCITFKVATKSEEVYVPKEVVIESAGGTDEQASSPAELKEKLLKIKTYDGDYYDSLEENEPDKEPTEGYYCSLGITVDGWLKDSEGNKTMDRRLVVAQNQLGAYYQMDGYSINNDKKTELNSIIGFSKYGMYLLNNSYNITSTKGESNNDEMQVFCDALNAKRGNFYKVAVEQKGSSMEDIMSMMANVEDQSNPSQAVMDASYDALGYQMAETIATSLYSEFVDTLNNNQTTLNSLITILNKFEDEENVSNYDGEYVYREEGSSMQIRLNLRDPSKPNFYIEDGDRQFQNILLEHINNAKVTIVSEGAGDFGDLLVKPYAEYYKKQYEDMMEKGMGA